MTLKRNKIFARTNILREQRLMWKEEEPGERKKEPTRIELVIAVLQTAPLATWVRLHRIQKTRRDERYTARLQSTQEWERGQANKSRSQRVRLEHVTNL